MSGTVIQLSSTIFFLIFIFNRFILKYAILFYSPHLPKNKKYSLIPIKLVFTSTGWIQAWTRVLEGHDLVCKFDVISLRLQTVLFPTRGMKVSYLIAPPMTPCPGKGWFLGPKIQRHAKASLMWFMDSSIIGPCQISLLLWVLWWKHCHCDLYLRRLSD